MNNLKRKVSLILSAIMLALVIFPLTISSAASQVTMTVKLEGIAMSHNGSYKVTGGEKITVNASSSQSSIAFMGYYFEDKGVTDANAYANKTVVNSNSMTITVPTYSAGTEKALWIEAVAANDNGTPNEETKTGWKCYFLEYVEKDVVVKHGGKTLTNGSTTTVKVGDKLEVNATPASSIKNIYYVWDADQSTMKKVAGSTATVTIPTSFASKVDHSFHVIVEYTNGKYAPQEDYYLKIAQEEELNMDVVVKYDGKTLSKGSTTTVKPGEKLQVSATPSDRVTNIYYVWDKNGNDIKKVAGPNATITIPESFASKADHSFHVIVKYDNGKELPQEDYYLKIAQEAENLKTDVVVKYDGKVLAEGSTTTVEVGEKLQVSATPSDRVTNIYYVWDENGQDIKKVAGANATITIPTSFESTPNHSFHVIAKYDNGQESTQEDYYLKINQGTSTPPTVPADPTDDDKLDVLPWEEDNDDLEALAIALRNDSESDKANKNLYALNEDVTYFIDFRNAGKDIKEEVTITLELPLNFEVVDAANGVVNTDKGTITWVYPQGMKDDYEGTKVVVVKYTAFDRNSTDSEKIYPVATIAKKDKIMDESAVINYIYKDEDTVIEDTHEPYMHGDYSTSAVTTFRPDATITRAEGALVLTRILLGQDAIDNVQVTSVYPDLGETYLEAQKAIIAATSYGLINGYTDGYYRPNQTMTRAEFMKIIAKFVELDAEDKGIDGLRIKEIEELVKLYKDPKSRYAVNGQLIGDHWAIEEVSLLVRLNMTSVDSNEKDLRMDQGITRAEVAQLVNFYLLRGPAEVNSKTKTQFTDVSKKHKLFADIVEATRNAHDYTITEEGTEIAE